MFFPFDLYKMLLWTKELTHRALSTSQRTFADTVDQDQTAQNVQSDL